MTRSWISLALGAALLMPLPASAQDQDVQVFVVGGRPRIGVVVDTEAGTANDKIGATIKSVTPDGPAAKAGLEAGDIITKFNGTSLAGEDPGERLVELAQALNPGDSVKVEYRRGSANRSATIVAADLGGRTMTWRSGPGEAQMFELERAQGQREMAMLDMQRSMDGMGRGFNFQFRRGGPGLELAEMNAGLGEYFGTSTGVLVLENPSDSTMPLKAGDVILGIGGRAPADIGQARRILASYDGGDVAKFEIMRMKKKTTVTWTVPNQPMRHFSGGTGWRSAMPSNGPGMPGAAPKTRVRVAPGPGAPAGHTASPAPPEPPAPAAVQS